MISKEFTKYLKTKDSLSKAKDIWYTALGLQDVDYIKTGHSL
ncbi:MAG: hypothetical protein BWX74_00692 [Tenericutes bacterium ADurb.Bin087]|nr:MAG: hypothetical protein BWX74_00692 [Tenericutes bacterium ADurb.Bin087]